MKTIVQITNEITISRDREESLSDENSVFHI